MNSIIEKLVLIFGSMYAYCTDFIINLSNLFQISYYETNFILFIVLFPLALVGSILYYLLQARRIKSLKKKISNQLR